MTDNTENQANIDSDAVFTKAIEDAGVAQPVTEPTELTDFEKEQQSQGWNPKGPKSAEEWAENKPLYDEISKRGRYIKKLERTMDELKEFMAKQEQRAYEKAITDLTNKKQAAISLGDGAEVLNIDKQISQTKPPPQKIPYAVEEFQERHKEWFNGSSYEQMEMTEWVKQRDSVLAAKGLPPDEHMALLEEHLFKKFPEYFNKKSNNYSGVESSTYGSTSVQKAKKTWTKRDLSSEQRRIGEDFERFGILTMDQYIKSLVDSGELK